MQQSTFSSKTNVCEGQTIRIIAEEPYITGMAVQNRPEYSTYHEDVAAVKDSFKKMLENGVYKADLFADL